jgi:hypothetical protein
MKAPAWVHDLERRHMEYPVQVLWGAVIFGHVLAFHSIWNVTVQYQLPPRGIEGRGCAQCGWNEETAAACRVGFQGRRRLWPRARWQLRWQVTSRTDLWSMWSFPGDSQRDLGKGTW